VSFYRLAVTSVNMEQAMRDYETRVGAVYYFRRVVPDDLIGFFTTANGKPRREWKYSLGTKDRNQATKPLRAWADATDNLIEEARAVQGRAPSPALSLPTTPRAVPSVVISQAEANDMEQLALEAADWDYERQEAEDVRAETDSQFAAERALRAATAALQRDREDIEWARQMRAESRAAQHISIMQLFERWAGQPGRNLRSVAQWSRYLEKLCAFLEHDDASRVSTADIRSWRNHLRDEATHKGKRLSPQTINGGYLSAVKTVFKHAADDGLIPDNPALPVPPVQTVKVAKLRERSHTDAEAATILRAASGEQEGRLSEYTRFARRWVPWVLAYCGARVGEIAQLRKEDVQQVAGIWVMNLTPEAGSIKDKEARKVPLHPHLIQQGFLTFVASRPDGPLFYDGQRQRKGILNHSRADKVTHYLREWVRSLGITTPQPNHAWRHRFITLARRYEMSERASKAIVGHAPGEQHLEYGDDELPVLLRELHKLPVEKL
jgi:integrase